MNQPQLPYIYNVGVVDTVCRTLIVTTMLILGAISIMTIFTDFASQWFWLIVATYYTITINDTFTHRVCSHRMFRVDPRRWWYKILTFLSSADLGHGPVRTIAIGHRAHHLYADQGRADPINMREFWFGAACALPLRGWIRHPKIPNFTKFLQISYENNRNIIDDPWTQFCERYTAVMALTYMTVLYFVAPWFLFKVVLPGRVILVLAMVCAGISHLKNVPLSYRNTDTPDQSSNNLLLHYLFLGIFGGLLQNNHHSHPDSLDTGKKWYEIDTSSPIAHLFKYLMQKKEAT